MAKISSTRLLFHFHSPPFSVPLISGVFSNFVLKPVLRPVFRVLSGLIAIPIFRFVIRHVFRVQKISTELEKDLEQWFKGSLILLAATANLEDFLFGWLPWAHNDDPWLTMLLRLILAVGVIEHMPDQELFAILHRGPPKIKLSSKKAFKEAWARKLEFLKGIGVLHLKRSSPVFVIMTVIFGGMVGSRDFYIGWIFYGLAITQYLIIGVITDGDRVNGLLAQFDKKADALRQEMLSTGPPPHS